VGSLLLGLYDQSGLLHHVGFTSSFKEEDKAPLTRKLEPLIKPPLALLVTNPVGRVAGVRSEVANGSSRGEVSG
jgi:ATP-dependent DNA ligase